MNELYERIMGLCDAAGIKPGKLCNDCGISRALISDLKYDRKKGTGAKNLQKIAAYFGISMEYLLGETENSPENRTVEMLQSLRDADRALLEVARGMDENAVYAAAEFIKQLKGGNADAD